MKKKLPWKENLHSILVNSISKSVRRLEDGVVWSVAIKINIVINEIWLYTYFSTLWRSVFR